MTTAAKMLEEIRAGFSLEGGFETDLEAEEIVESFAAAIAPRVTDDFLCVMAGGALSTTYEGIEGLRAGWMDFLGAFETLAITPEEYRESPDGSCVVEFVHLSGRPRGLSATIEQDGSALWRLRGDRLEAVEFHLDRDEALRRGGLGPA